jgi:ABC-2 type transport system permease protein
MGFGVPFRGSFPVFIIISSVFILTALGQGLLISALTKNQFLACVVASMLGLLPSMMLSGFLFEISSMPKIFQFITYFVPSRYFTPCLQNLFLAETIWEVLLPQFFILIFIAILLFFIVHESIGKKLE